MIRLLFASFLFLFISDGICGVSVIGTRFTMNNDMRHLNIKVVNDNESDYLIKNTLDDKDFIISPPLFLLPKNGSSLVTVILKEKKPFDRDKVFNLTLTAIPKSVSDDDSNSVSLAIRNHFKIIYRHAELTDRYIEKIRLSHEDNRCVITNNSDFAVTVSLAQDKNDTYAKIINLSPYEKRQLEYKETTGKCVVWVNFYNEYNDVINTIQLTK